MDFIKLFLITNKKTSKAVTNSCKNKTNKIGFYKGLSLGQVFTMVSYKKYHSTLIPFFNSQSLLTNSPYTF